jgi:hypothetical protein
MRSPLTDDFNHPISAPTAQTQQPYPQLQQAYAQTQPREPAQGSVRQGSGPLLVSPEDGENIDRQRQRVTEHLRAIGRLPPRHATMPASVLRSIDAMYALLPSATDDIQRKSVMRQAFANEGSLRVALLGLIELMDSSVDTSDPVIQEAKIEALIKILLFEEQRRKENGRFPAAGFPPSPFNAPRRSSSVPPPSSRPGSFNRRAGEGYYFPQQAPASAPSSGYGGGGGQHVPTQRPPPPVLANGAYPASAPPLPNLPAEPRRRTMPPPLPPTYPRG